MIIKKEGDDNEQFFICWHKQYQHVRDDTAEDEFTLLQNVHLVGLV